MDIGTILVFVVIAIMPIILYGMLIEGRSPEKEVIFSNCGMSSASVLASRLRMEAAIKEGGEAFAAGLTLDDCPHTDNGIDARYGLRFNLNHHWKKGFVEKTNIPGKSEC